MSEGFDKLVEMFDVVAPSLSCQLQWPPSTDFSQPQRTPDSQTSGGLSVICGLCLSSISPHFPLVSGVSYLQSSPV